MATKEYSTSLQKLFLKKTTHTVGDTWADYKVPWECYKSPTTNLVYFIHNKCASTLYDLLMIELAWLPFDTQQIDWEHNIVVSHIRDPLIKHRKGIVEGIVQCFPATVSFLSTDTGANLLSNITSVDPHSLTIRQMLDTNALKVRWIPIDTALDHKKFTIDLFENFGEIIPNSIKQWFLELPVVNASTVAELNLYNKLIAMPTPSDILRLIDFDMSLYNSIIVPDEPANFQARVSQLIELGQTYNEAIDQADRELFSGEYLQWTC